MSFLQIHDLVLYMMVVIVFFALFIVIERAMFFFMISNEGKKVESYLHDHIKDPSLYNELLSVFSKFKSPQAKALCDVVRVAQLNPSHEKMEYMIQSIYVAKKPEVTARLWILDTIITLSPLLGLLGTILGIIDAFTSLSSGNVAADPTSVSRGIGTALYATGFGIFIALFALLFFNYFNNKVEAIVNQMKFISLSILGVEKI
ncbi:MAG: hypothetical protein B7Z60_05905 [Ferrovum sp. 37-45-19]|nr:MAG: hypothetical protein B7Z60_05905 [Ferrovum sp. 37-45-19]HQT81733.1 MotA/TolQ/ExbB proton channel family protein [Ferrovaceae bacterium]HQU07035.1 MotA/TolQ/ExbB proton channel family protein [Ferrovaceae bacterium]